MDTGDAGSDGAATMQNEAVLAPCQVAKVCANRTLKKNYSFN